MVSLFALALSTPAYAQVRACVDNGYSITLNYWPADKDHNGFARASQVIRYRFAATSEPSRPGPLVVQWITDESPTVSGGYWFRGELFEQGAPEWTSYNWFDGRIDETGRGTIHTFRGTALHKTYDWSQVGSGPCNSGNSYSIASGVVPAGLSEDGLRAYLNTMRLRISTGEIVRYAAGIEPDLVRQLNARRSAAAATSAPAAGSAGTAGAAGTAGTAGAAAAGSAAATRSSGARGTGSSSGASSTTQQDAQRQADQQRAADEARRKADAQAAAQKAAEEQAQQETLKAQQDTLLMAGAGFIAAALEAGHRIGLTWTTAQPETCGFLDKTCVARTDYNLWGLVVGISDVSYIQASATPSLLFGSDDKTVEKLWGVSLLLGWNFLEVEKDDETGFWPVVNLGMVMGGEKADFMAGAGFGMRFFNADLLITLSPFTSTFSATSALAIKF